MRTLLIATHNKGKFPEIAALLDGLPIRVISLADLGFDPSFEVEEPAMTFEGNALVKAMTLAVKTGHLTLADDSGLQVDALQGRPGVKSARYVPGTDEDRYRKILEELGDLPEVHRGAQFQCVIAIADPTLAKVRTCEGVYRGRILTEPRGTNGFGYDPIFWNEALGKTNAEMTTQEKNAVSHRGIALRAARELLEHDFLR